MKLMQSLTVALLLMAAPAFASDNSMKTNTTGTNATSTTGTNATSTTGAATTGENATSAMMPNEMGSHEMTGKITSLDTKSGKVGVTAGGIKLQLHFPPDSLAGVKKGDTITVHMSFTKA